MKDYYIIGGEYANTDFDKLLDKSKQEVFGPFDKKTAYQFWQAKTSEKIDICNNRYFIVHKDKINL